MKQSFRWGLPSYQDPAITNIYFGTATLRCHSMKLLILNESCISLFHCKAIGSFLSFYTCSELRRISLDDVFDFTKPA